MKRTTLWLAIALVVVAGCRPADKAPLAAPAASPAAAPASAVDPPTEVGADWRGFAGSILGDTVAQLHVQQAQPLPGAPSDGGGCYYLRPSAVADQDVAFMIDADTFVRYDVRTGTRSAPGGGRIGMTLSQLQAVYPESAELQPHKYIEGGYDLRITSPVDGGGVLTFEIEEDGNASAWRLGLEPQVDYVEGCS